MWSWLKGKKYYLLGILTLFLLGWFFFGRGSRVEYDSYAVGRGDIQETLELSGQIEAAQTATLRFGAGGLVTYLGAKEGDAVKKWQTIAGIDTRQLQKVLEQKLNLYKSQLDTFDDTQDKYKNEIEAKDIDNTLRRILDRNQFFLENTVKDVEYQDLSIKLSRISSPLSGILVHAPVTTTGVNVLATDTWTIVDPASLYFSADLDETDLKRVSLGQATNVSLDAFPDQTLASSVASLAFAPTETTSGTTYKVKFNLPASELTNFRLGLNGTAAIILTQKDGVLTLPSQAITTQDGKSMVYVQNGSKYTTKPVETGVENNGMVEIVSGLNEGDRVYAVK